MYLFRSNLSRALSWSVLVMIQAHWRYKRVMFNYSLIAKIAQCLTARKAQVFFLVFFAHSCKIAVDQDIFFPLAIAFEPKAPYRLCFGVTLLTFASLSGVSLQYICSKSHTGRRCDKNTQSGFSHTQLLCTGSWNKVQPALNLQLAKGNDQS